MGIQEKEVKKRAVPRDLTRVVLQVVGLAGILAAGLVAPGAVRVMQQLGIRPKRRDTSVIQRSRDRLLRAGLLARNKDGFLRLTARGHAVLRDAERTSYQTKKRRRWDKRWRILMFDIPNRRKGLRDKIRRTLTQIGFIRLQQSVWVYPYDCEDLITLLKADFKVGKDLLYIIAESIEGDQWLRSEFNL